VKQVLALDLGASNGRAILGKYDGEKLYLQEIHRFENIPIEEENTLYWDIEALFFEIKNSLRLAAHISHLDSVGIDTWGVDFGLLDSAGNLLARPVHYRDRRTEGMSKKAEKILTKEKLYQLTGNQILDINTLFQLMSLKERNVKQFEQINKLLLMPDLFNYLLTNTAKTEITIASTTQLFDPYKKKWSKEILNTFHIPESMMGELVEPGATIGNITPVLAEELGIAEIPVIAVGSHDTASAIASVPCNEEFLFISSGTWSLIGTEIKQPIINETSLYYNITNESSADKTTSLLKNIAGLWMIQETKRQFEREGRIYSYSELAEIAQHAKPFNCYLDTDYLEFQHPGNIPKRIRQYAAATDQYVPNTDAEIVRVIYESLALKYRLVIEEIQEVIGKEYSIVNIVGGGAQAEILCQMTANAVGKKVIAGPAEATAIGNIIVQLIGSGAIQDLQQAREIVKSSFRLVEYQPKDEQLWKQHYEIYCHLLKVGRLHPEQRSKF